MKADTRLFKITEFILGILFIVLAILLFFFSCFLLNEECEIFRMASMFFTLITFLINIFYCSKLSLKLKKTEIINFVHTYKWIKFLSTLCIVLNLLSFTKGYTRKNNQIIVKNNVTIKEAKKEPHTCNGLKDSLKIKLGTIEIKNHPIKSIVNCNHPLNVTSFKCKDNCKVNDSLINSLFIAIQNLNNKPFPILHVKDSIHEVSHSNTNINKLKIKQKKNKISEGKKKVISKIYT